MLAVAARTAEVKIRVTGTPSIMFPYDQTVIQFTHSIKSEPNGKLKAAFLKLLYQRFSPARNIKRGRPSGTGAGLQPRLDLVQDAVGDGEDVGSAGLRKGQPNRL